MRHSPDPMPSAYEYTPSLASGGTGPANPGVAALLAALCAERHREQRIAMEIGERFVSVPRRILVAALIDRIEGRRTMVSGLCVAALPCPQSTALRRIDEMERAGLLARQQSTDDRRVIFIDPTAKAIDLMAGLLLGHTSTPAAA